MTSDSLLAVTEARKRFLRLVPALRPELHRYCARMTGSVSDGEDVVQDALGKAWHALPELESVPPLRPWLFKIAHNTALDFMRRYDRRNVELVPDFSDSAELVAPSSDGARVEAALAVFASLPPVQRSALALKDVLGLSLDETARTMGTTVAAVKAALVRARANVAAASAPGAVRAPLSDLTQFRRYAELFDARDWEGLRSQFSREARLSVVSREPERGASAAPYFTHWALAARAAGSRLAPCATTCSVTPVSTSRSCASAP